MYLPRRPLSARWWPGQGHAVNDALTLRSTVTNSNRATPYRLVVIPSPDGVLA